MSGLARLLQAACSRGCTRAYPSMLSRTLPDLQEVASCSSSIKVYMRMFSTVGHQTAVPGTLQGSHWWQAGTRSGTVASGARRAAHTDPAAARVWSTALIPLRRGLSSKLASPGTAATLNTATAYVSGSPAALGRVLVGGEALAQGLSPAVRRQMAWWLGGTAAWVYTLVILGGITRLTRSGLSMTDWKFTGERPPLTQADWMAEFSKYQQSPEFKLIHSRMTLDEFKFIFWMEYGHRMWGRFLGLAFAAPAAYFAARGYINRPLAKRLGLLFLMGGTQGLVGWWMVRSGLKAPEHDWQQVRVSPYRLAGHLVSAFTIFATLTWTALDLMNPIPWTHKLSAAAQTATARVRSLMLPFSALVAITATSGAFVAGMDAGRAYNEFPLMGGQLVPEEYWELWTRGFPVRNFFENTAAVQFDHRLLATTTAVAALSLWAWIRQHAPGVLPKQAVLGANLVAGITAVQWGLGVWTLLEYVPTHLGSAHQANALNLFAAVLFCLHALRPAQAGHLTHMVARWGIPAATCGVAGVAWTVTRNV